MTNDRSLVSVIIPTYNRPALVERAIASFLRQTYRHLEVIVVNDGGSHEVAAHVAAFGDPRTRYLWKENGGLASARNFGLRQARGEYVTFCDDDDEVLPERLERHLAYLDATDSNVSFCNCYVVTGDRQKLYFPTPPKGTTFELLFCQQNAPVHCFLVARRCFEKTGGFDETLPVCEDYDLWLRLLPHYRFTYLHEPLVRYYLHDANMSRNQQLMSRYAHRIIGRYFSLHRKDFTRRFRLRFRYDQLVRMNELYIHFHPRRFCRQIASRLSTLSKGTSKK